MLALYKRIQPLSFGTGKFRINPLQLLLRVHKRPEGFKCCVVYGLVGVRNGLGHAHYAGVFCAEKLARVVTFLPEQYTEQRGFAAAVHAD